MYTLTKEILLLTEIAACIASDNFKLLQSKSNNYKKQGYDPLKLYELILQSYLFCGFPAAIESLKIFRKHFNDLEIQKYNHNVIEFRSSGIVNCKLIYKKNYKKLIENMNSLGPDLKEWMLIEGYGKVLGRPNLSLKDRELVNVAILCTHYYESQLHSHMRGCLNLGIDKKVIKKMLGNLKSISDMKNINKAMKLLDKITIS
ncbi:MAG: carboxymuconolactone decarboxylase family protein [Ignavibacteria bacterium]